MVNVRRYKRRVKGKDVSVKPHCRANPRNLTYKPSKATMTDEEFIARRSTLEDRIGRIKVNSYALKMVQNEVRQNKFGKAYILIDEFNRNTNYRHSREIYYVVNDLEKLNRNIIAFERRI